MTRKVEDVSLPLLRSQYYEAYSVPEEGRAYVNSLSIRIEDQAYFPAFTVGNEITLSPHWANPGVLAHEMAHVIWFAFLTDNMRTQFSLDFNWAALSDPLTQLLDSKNDYMNTNYIEAHAEIYRYLGKFMPKALRKYYPQLLIEEVHG